MPPGMRDSLYFVDFSECSSTSAPTLNSCIGGVIIAIIIIKIDIIIKMIVMTPKWSYGLKHPNALNTPHSLLLSVSSQPAY